MERPIYSLPPLFRACLVGHEVSIELRTPTYAAPYLSNRHCPQATMNSSHCPWKLSELIEAQQLVRSVASLRPCPNPPKQRPSASAGEVRVYLFLKAHVANHQEILSPSILSSLEVASEQIRSLTIPSAPPAGKPWSLS